MQKKFPDRRFSSEVMGKNKDVLEEEPADTLQEHPPAIKPPGTTQFARSKESMHQHQPHDEITYTEQGFVYTGLVTTV